jgi:MFS family permease
LRRAHTGLTVALAGMTALAVAMGIGRFAFTPLLPLMLQDGVVNLHGASWLASANYLGYLAGALLCTFQPWLASRLRFLPALRATAMVRGGMVATALLTLGMALPLPAAWPVWRFAAGVASAVVFVYSSGWCLAQLARRDAGALGGLMFAGPGAGIVVSGLAATALVAAQGRAASGWLIFGALAGLLTAAVWQVFFDEPVTHLAEATPSANLAAAEAEAARPPGPRSEIAWLTFAYGLAGFGYIVTATFLPVIARQALPGSPWLGLFWPILGLGVIVGASSASRLNLASDRRLMLAGAYLMQAAGIGLGLWRPSLFGFVGGSLLLGLPFTAITFFAMQEVRRLRPAQTPSTMGLLTAAYGIGQIVGPPLVALMLSHTRSAARGFDVSLELAATALVIGALSYLGMVRAYPLNR